MCAVREEHDRRQRVVDTRDECGVDGGADITAAEDQIDRRELRGCTASHEDRLRGGQSSPAAAACDSGGEYFTRTRCGSR
eukprot:scaffold187149_cov30-Tisochrysis_lutea.AAC.1